MITNYLKTALRNLNKNKTYGVLNIFGLSIGIVCTCLILLWVEDEVNFNSYIQQKDNTWLTKIHWNLNNQLRTYTSTSGPVGPATMAEIPGIKSYARSTEGYTSALFNYRNNPTYSYGRYVDPDFLNIFECRFIEGSAAEAFTQVHSLVITEKTAKKLFNTTTGIVGKTITVDNTNAYTITGVVKDIPLNASVRFDWLAPLAAAYQGTNALNNWEAFQLETYFQTTPGTNITAITSKMNQLAKQNIPSYAVTYSLLNMNDWRLRSEYENGIQSGGRIIYVRLFLIIAGIILLVACINFMNLATARSEQRAKEVGVRKALGAGKGKLITQFIGEAIVQAVLATLVAILLLALVLPAFNTLVNKSLSLQLLQPSHLLALLALTLCCGLLAGSYPALYLSNFNPVAILKGFKVKSGGAAFIRKGLVVAQFSISIVLIIATVIIYQQIQHVKSRDLGFNIERLISIDATGDVVKNFASIRDALYNTGAVEKAALADHNPLYDGNSTDRITWDGKPADASTITSMRFIGPGFLETTGMQLLEGQNFTREADDSINVMVNQAFAKQIGAGSPLGKMLYARVSDSVTMKFRIAGVVKDYVYGDMYGSPDPVMFLGIPSRTNTIYARLNANIAPEVATARIGEVMRRFNPAYPFTYGFTDKQFNDMFQNEMLMQQLSRIFASIAIIISCLGLFGLSAYTAERRTKEIGIRKVLGASTQSITTLLSLDFLKLVGISMLIAFPTAWWMMVQWLEQYKYHVKVSPVVFVLAGITAILITMLTISYQSIRASMADPVKSLKTE
ncbi:duplicated orphan permease [Chitinophaga jiangningensis]|uniref:Duplicated orphan permease n=1 Tax=Chitinophaga jiangningensis TaxID=1419482 RepID=A0A1M7L4Q7_9BACT|nr:ABC transporter permease [Chitinophaga jiangningensis]SHM72774.1 duplicated orphan permease [Chitinophaga jiangningensis]